MGLDKIKESKGFFTRGKTPEQKGKTLLRVMKSDLEKKLKGVPHSLSPDGSGTRIVIKVRPADVDKTKKLVGLPNMTKVVSEVGLVGVDEGRVRKTVKVGEDALVGEGKPHYALVFEYFVCFLLHGQNLFAYYTKKTNSSTLGFSSLSFSTHSTTFYVEKWNHQNHFTLIYFPH